MPDASRSRRRAWEREAARRAAAARGEATAEDRIVAALLIGSPQALADAAILHGRAESIDRDYLAYWVDELRLQEPWRAPSGSPSGSD